VVAQTDRKYVEGKRTRPVLTSKGTRSERQTPKDLRERGERGKVAPRHKKQREEK